MQSYLQYIVCVSSKFELTDMLADVSLSPPLSFQANPIRQYPGITLYPSDRGPTFPQGPNLMSLSRTRNVVCEHQSSDGGSCNGDSSSSPHSSTDEKS